MQVRLFKPSVGAEELANIKEVFERAWLGLGPMVGQFEKEWTQYVGCAASVGVNSATAALHLAVTAFKFPEGAKILVPAMTFVSTASAALYNRHEVVFVDIDPATLSMDLDDLERKARGCSAVIPVHMGGHPVQMDRLLEIARRYGLAVIEDCAHCAGGSYRGRKLGTWGDIGCFSFEEKKSMTTGDGGMISSNNPDLIEPLRAYRWVGIDKDTWKRSPKYTSDQVDARHWYYEVGVLGYKYNMNDLMAAIGLAQLKKLDRMNRRRTEIIARYLNGIAACERIRPLLPYDLSGNSSYWIFGVRCQDRDAAIVHLKQKGIATSVHYMPLTMHPLFRPTRQTAPVAEKIWKNIITLPLFPDMSNEEVDYVVDALMEFEHAGASQQVLAVK
jgi:perosamine synthetase